MDAPGKQSAVYREDITVTPDAIDRNGHVNNVVFVQWMQDVAVRHFSAAGCLEPSRAAGGMWVVRAHQVEYRQPAFAGDRLQIITWIVNFSRVRSLRRYKFLRVPDGKLIVRGETDWVFVNASTGRPASIPAAISDAFERLPPDQEPPSPPV